MKSETVVQEQGMKEVGFMRKREADSRREDVYVQKGIALQSRESMRSILPEQSNKPPAIFYSNHLPTLFT